jgi:hypothetical protein
MSTSPETEQSSRFQTMMAILIALVTLLGAALGTRAALISTAAGDEDFYGLAASLSAEETEALNTLTMYRNYRAYAAYTRYNVLGDLVAKDWEQTSDETQSEALGQAMQTAWAMAVAVNRFFPARYLNRDGRYDPERELGEAWAEAAMKKDLDPQPHFAAANLLRSKVSRLLIIIILLTAAVWFFTLAQGLRHALRYVLAVGGGGLMLVGIAAAVLEELVHRGGG